ncbi:MAG TPA: sigma 54-interacting transcriptional regulator, partial [Planctomycetota bacterium]|nr:sigma 54-interacting transcriptional regulator [Planctomycetota bacterium]
DAEVLLFGRAQGAGTPGIFELADGGTIFFDEITQLPGSVQARVVRVVETGEVQRPGLATLHRVDVRLIAASKRDLQQSSLLPALTYVFAGKSLVLPPLRERAGDIERLTQAMLDHQAATLHHSPKRLTPEARAVLLRYGWPGNVRELRQVVERALVMANGAMITPADLPDFAQGATPSHLATVAIEPLAVMERAHILRVLEHCGGNKKAAAELLEIDRSTLYAKLKQYDVS